MPPVVATRAGTRLVVRARELRGAQTLSAVAARAGIRQDELGKIERGETRSIRFDTLLRLCSAYRVTPAELFDVEPEEAIMTATNPLDGVRAAMARDTTIGHAPPRARTRRAADQLLTEPSTEAAARAMAGRESVARTRRRTTVPETAAARVAATAGAAR